MSYRLYDPAPVYLDADGVTPCAGGKLHTYQHGTTTPATTWADAGLSIPNANPLILDSAGRANADIWADAPRTLRLETADGRTVWTRNVDSGAGAGATIPALQTGQVLTNDGSQLQWAPFLEVPDPTGAEGLVLKVLSGLPVWAPEQAIPEPPRADQEVGATSFRIGNMLVQMGTATSPASNSWFSAVDVTFPRAFSSLLYIGATLRTTSVGVQSGIPALATLNWTPGSPGAAATFYWRNITVAGGAGDHITKALPFTWIAIGLIA